ncbi:MAG: hypothetical protein ACRD0F_06655, partial [Acidimicrobiales bacterium]
MTVTVQPDGPAIGRAFDYAVPPGLGRRVEVGTMVRVDLHGRRVGGWVVSAGVPAPAGVQLRALARVSGVG